MSSKAELERQLAELQIKMAEVQRQIDEQSKEINIFKNAGIDPNAPLPEPIDKEISELYNKRYGNSKGGNSRKSKRNKKLKGRNKKRGISKRQYKHI